MSEIILTDADDFTAPPTVDDGSCQKCGRPEKDQQIENGFGGYMHRICRGCGNDVDLSEKSGEA